MEGTESSTPLRFIISSRKESRLIEVRELILRYASKIRYKGKISIDFSILDLSNKESVIRAKSVLEATASEINYVFVNSAYGVCGGINWWKAVLELIMNPVKAVTDPGYKLQEVGLKSKDGMGLIFQVNVFAPHFLIMLLLPQLKAGKAKIIWISSLRSDQKYLSLQDLELLKTEEPYEGSKREIDLLHLATFKELKEMGITQYVTQPGIFTSQAFSQFLNPFTYYGMLLMLYFARLMGSTWHTIEGYTAACAPVYVALTSDKDCLQQDIKYGSATYRNGDEYVKLQELDNTACLDVYSFIRKKELEWSKELLNSTTGGSSF